MAKPKIEANPGLGASNDASTVTYSNLVWKESQSGESLLTRFKHPDTGRDSMFIVSKKTYGDTKGVIKASILAALFAGPNRAAGTLSGEDRDTGELYEVDTYFPAREDKTVAEPKATAFGQQAAPREKPTYTVVPPRQTT
jgi:hypothetical protein